MVHRLAEDAEADLDKIWWRIATQSGSVAIAQGVIASITERFYLLASQPRMGRTRDDLEPGLRSHPADEFMIIYTIEDDDVVILHVCSTVPGTSENNLANNLKNSGLPKRP
jgi:toxin ParE1/3/4